jgi:hypothetical protein
MTTTSGRWVVYEKRGVEYVLVSKRFKTKQESTMMPCRLSEPVTLVLYRKYGNHRIDRRIQLRPDFDSHRDRLRSVSDERPPRVSR